MPFSKTTHNEIWRRDGGKEAACATCGKKHSDGWNLDCSHLDHTRDATYDHPSRGILECLDCHFLRHLNHYFGEALRYDRWKMKAACIPCLLLGMRIVMKESRWDVYEPIRPRKMIREGKKYVRNLIRKQLTPLEKWAKSHGECPDNIKRAKHKMNELIDVLC